MSDVSAADLDAAEQAVEKTLGVNPEMYLLMPSGRPVKASEIVRIALAAVRARETGET